jgi:hypothetical protein
MPHLSDRPLVVYPNPFHALDHKGRPACAVRLDPDFEVSAGERRYIGAKLTSTMTQKFHEKNHPGLAMGKGHYDRVWAFDIAPTPIPDTHYHRDRIRDGELVAADKRTFRAAMGGGSKKKFIEPLQLLLQSREAAAEHWSREQDDEDPPALTLRLPGDPEPETLAVAHEETATEEASATPDAAADAPETPQAAPTELAPPMPDAGATRAMRQLAKQAKTTTDLASTSTSAKAEKPEG